MILLAETFRNNVFELLDEYGWSQLDLAIALGKTPQAVNNTLRRTSFDPRLSVIEEWASALQVDPSELLKIKEKNS